MKTTAIKSTQLDQSVKKIRLFDKSRTVTKIKAPIKTISNPASTRKEDAKMSISPKILVIII